MQGDVLMDERSLIYDWNTVEYDTATEIPQTTRTVFGLMTRHLRDGLAEPERS